jgi:putative serine protease PepD
MGSVHNGGVTEDSARPSGTQPVPGSTVLVLATAVAAVLGGAISGLVVHHAEGTTTHRSQVTLGAPTVSNGTSVHRPDGSVAAVAAKILPSVVSLEVRRGNSGDTGTGIVISSDGYILTNNHVVADVSKGARLSVVFADEQQVPGTVVGRDTVNDLAVVRVDEVSGLRAATLGSSAGLAVGDPVIAVGSPLGLAGTVTTGIISALDRPVAAGDSSSNADDLIDAIQTDAAINPGNSGGPLLDADGAVIGVNSAIATLSAGSALGSSQGGNIGLGFAIPIDQAKRIASQIIAHGYATHAVIGVHIEGGFAGVGAQIASGSSAVEPAGPAGKAGLRAGDVIVALDGRTITSAEELIALIRKHAPGERITVTYVRSGHRRTATVVLGSRRSD